MTVGELIGALRNYPKDMEICTADDYYGRPVEILYVKPETAEILTVIDGEPIRATRDVVVIH